MLKLGKRYITFGCVAATVFFISGHVNGDSYLCETEQASGFVYDLDNEKWEASTFSIVDKKYLIAPADTNNVFINPSYL